MKTTTQRRATATWPCWSWIDRSPWTATSSPFACRPKNLRRRSCCRSATTPCPAGARGPSGATWSVALYTLSRCPPSFENSPSPSCRTPTAPREPSSTSPATCYVQDTWEVLSRVAVEMTGARWSHFTAPPTSWQVWWAGGGAVRSPGIMGCSPTWLTSWSGWRRQWWKLTKRSFHWMQLLRC